MRLALIQTKQNGLYQFDRPALRYAREEAAAGQREMLAQNLRLMGEAPACDLMVTTEAINFAGPPRRVDGDYAALIGGTLPGLIAGLSGLAREKGCYVAAGLYAEGERIAAYTACTNFREPRGLYNTLWLFDRQGAVSAVYCKTHLTEEEALDLLPGHGYMTADTDFGRLGLAICWDMQFPETCQALSSQGADLILAPTWGWESIYGPARAYENGVFVAAAMAVPYQGGIAGLRTPSQVIAPDGRILAQGSPEGAEVVCCEIADLAACRPFRAMRLRGRIPGLS